MTGEEPPAPVQVRDAATVMLVRDGAEGLEVFMMRRTLKAVFVGGLYVFPGGAVDVADRHEDLGPVCEGLTDAEASRLLGVDEGGLAYWVAAVRECFEEAGVLLARGDDGVVRFDDPDVAARFNEDRHRVHRGELRLVDLCEREGLRITTDAIHYVSHWITPEGEPRRFDTRFFVARAPDAQEPLHDDGETIASLWVRPADALRRHEEGELAMITPTLSNLSFLVPFASADDALAAAALVRDPPTIRPSLSEDRKAAARFRPSGDDPAGPGEAGTGTTGGGAS
jgi:8-oxo-dGTP pyrophosphatase MutT (NUDIX family)